MEKKLDNGKIIGSIPRFDKPPSKYSNFNDRATYSGYKSIISNYG